MLISEEYRKLNSQLHESNGGYGTSGHKWKVPVIGLAEAVGADTILDYGCGKQTLKQAIESDRDIVSPTANNLTVTGYDPAIPALSAAPEPHDMVVCGDVLEHIEPECLDAVLKDLWRVTRKLGLFIVATRPAKKMLADGRNAHLIQQPMSWWVEKMSEHFVVLDAKDMGGEFFAVVKPRFARC